MFTVPTSPAARQRSSRLAWSVWRAGSICVARRTDCAQRAAVRHRGGSPVAAGRPPGPPRRKPSRRGPAALAAALARGRHCRHRRGHGPLEHRSPLRRSGCDPHARGGQAQLRHAHPPRGRRPVARVRRQRHALLAGRRTAGAVRGGLPNTGSRSRAGAERALRR